MNFNFCPNCGQKGTVKKHDDTKYECTICHEVFWNNPKATATTIFLNKDGQILFSKRGIAPKKGFYDLPGGFLEYHEDAYVGAAREIYEESGVRIKNPKLFAVHNNEYLPGVSTCDLLFLATEWEGKFDPQDDVAAFEWHPIDVIDSDEFAWSYPGLTDQLRSYIKENRL